jgi:hypothetical protein
MAQQTPLGPASESNAVDLISEVARQLYNLKIDDGSIVVDNQSALKKYAEFVRLRELMQNDWRTVVTEVLADDPDSVTRAILLVSAQGLSPDLYRDFLDRMIDLVETGEIEKTEMKWAIFPPSPKLAKVWIETWRDEKTRKSVERIKKIFGDDSSMTSYCVRLLSGHLQKDATVTENAMKSPEVLPESQSAPDIGVDTFVQYTPALTSPPSTELTPLSTEEPPSSTPWSIIVVLIVAATGLLWLLVKNRK